jgi:rare lipoprotein A
LPLLISENQKKTTEGVQSIGALSPAVGVENPGTVLQRAVGSATSAAASTRQDILAEAAAAEASAIAASAASATTMSVALTSAPTVSSARLTTTSRPTAVTQAPATGNAEEGKATFLSFDSAVYGDRPCSHRTLPIGTVISVTNLNNGKTATCVVQDRGPYVAGRLIDLDVEVFADLADPAVGVIPVRITW